MKIITTLMPLLWAVSTSFAQPGGEPPLESKLACKDRATGARCEFAGPGGQETGTCAYTPDNRFFSCRPERGERKQQREGTAEAREPRSFEQKYSVEQAISNNAQLNTISFAAMSFMSGDLCDMSFLPPGKHASYFGFQYLRDVFGGEQGHGQDFVPRVANNLLYILNDKQTYRLIKLARQQAENINKFAVMRFPLLVAFEKYGKNELPEGRSQLSRKKIIEQSAALYAVDGVLSYDRAVGFGAIVNSLSDAQKSALDALKNRPFSSWPTKGDQVNKRELNHDVYVALMTYASELFSWYVGDEAADLYFTPERTAAYFGSYWTKAAPMKAVKRKSYQISIELTGNSGASFLDILNSSQKGAITGLVQSQRRLLVQMVDLRKDIVAEIRKIFAGEQADREKIVQLSRQFGELDGEIAYLYGNTFANIRQSLTKAQMDSSIRLRNIDQYNCNGAFIYAEPIKRPTNIDVSGFFQ